MEFLVLVSVFAASTAVVAASAVFTTSAATTAAAASTAVAAFTATTATTVAALTATTSTTVVATATAAATTATAESATRRTILLRTCDVYIDATPIEFFSVKTIDCCLCLFIRTHRNEGKAAGATGHFIRHQNRFCDGAVSGKGFHEYSFGCSEGEVPDE
jgi:hypothetical protein